ncbi:MAG: siphovirus ReqiPepy6 Gp37-like family protein [Oscillospiraceae bacterium]|nr:siphovirus ReqiPepy6 Gp37-like family protein [Oscillospiraceae bacterium]
MEALVMDTSFVSVDVVDTFDSFIWAERYSRCGDFEILTPVDGSFLNMLIPDYYLYMNGSEKVMIIEGREISTDPEEGNHLVFTGRSLESILDRRIVWRQTILSGNFQDGILTLLNENAISPTDPNRIIPGLIFVPSADPVITELTIQAQFTGDNLYVAIQSLCETKGIGFKITLTENNLFKFELYAGVNRSYDQFVNPYVVFSPKFDNILSSNYVETKRAEKTVTLVAGEGEGAARKTAVVGTGVGLSRREMFTDARDISSTVDGGELTPEQYTSQLEQRGAEKLSENTFISLFEGQVDASTLYKYGVDFFMGDILQLANEYEMEAKTRVVELIRSQSAAGEDIYPTFAAVE